MSKYQTLSQECPKCGKQVSLYSEIYINIDEQYSYLCPYCDNQAKFKGSLAIESNKIPKNAVLVKLA